MRNYLIKYKNGESKEIEVADRNELIELLFEGSESSLKAQVESLHWKKPSLVFTEDVKTGKITSQMSTADSNPYGWRNEAGE